MHSRPDLMHMLYAVWAATFLFALYVSPLIAIVLVVASVMTLLI